MKFCYVMMLFGPSGASQCFPDRQPLWFCDILDTFMFQVQSVQRRHPAAWGRRQRRLPAELRPALPQSPGRPAAQPCGPRAAPPTDHLSGAVWSSAGSRSQAVENGFYEVMMLLKICNKFDKNHEYRADDPSWIGHKL